jgi:hypothetical protein
VSTKRPEDLSTPLPSATSLSRSESDWVDLSLFPAIRILNGWSENGDFVPPRQPFRVSVTLRRDADDATTTEQGDPNRPGAINPAKVPPGGDDAEGAWKFDVELTAPSSDTFPASGASTEGDTFRTRITPKDPVVRVYPNGTSISADFDVLADFGPGVPAGARRTLPLVASFFRHGVLLGRASRVVTVTATAPPPTPVDLTGQYVQRFRNPARDATPIGDLRVDVFSYPNWDGGRLIMFATVLGREKPRIAWALYSKENIETLDAAVTRIASRSDRRALIGEAVPPLRPKNERNNAIDGTLEDGTMLASLTPKVVIDAIHSLQDNRPQGADIHIQTNFPSFPWELLVLPKRRGDTCDSSRDACEFLGIRHRVSRWHIASRTQDPEATLGSDEFTLITPNYLTKPLAAVRVIEVPRIKEFAGQFRRQVKEWPGEAASVRDYFAGPQGPSGIVHFAGHGQASPTELDFVLELESGVLDLRAFRLTANLRRGPLLFLNACEVGGATAGGGFLEGWGPNSVEKGARGFIGGIWRLGDVGAATFAGRFYERALQGVAFAEAIRCAREGFYDTGDTTYLAYVFYGHADLRVSRHSNLPAGNVSCRQRATAQ